MLVGIIIAIALIAFAVYAIDGTAKGAKEVIAKRQWWRLYIAGGAVLVFAVFAATYQ